MILKRLTEVVWRVFQEGRVNAQKQTILIGDVNEAVRMGYGNVMRALYYASKKSGEGDEYYFFSGDLDTKKFALGESNILGKRRATIPDEVARLPRNADIVNVYPVAGGCGNEEAGEITQVQPGEENFYLSAEYAFFKFFVQKGRNIDTYNLPPCVKEIEVERIYVNDNMEISLDMAMDIAQSVWGILFKNKTVWDADRVKVTEQLQKMEGVK